jgi:hypothetical protein
MPIQTLGRMYEHAFDPSSSQQTYRSSPSVILVSKITRLRLDEQLSVALKARLVRGDREVG